MKSSLEHYCFSQHLNEKKPPKCRCRKKVTLAEATKMVEKGFAEWLVVKTTYIVGAEICPICQNGDTKKGCQHCRGFGEVAKTYPFKEHNNDIVLVTAGCSDENGKTTYRSVLAKKTPRVATIEKAHIIRAYVDDDKEEQERIEEYGLMTLLARIEMGIGVEPPDNPVTATGRKYDVGKAPYGRTGDERTHSGGIGSRITRGFATMEPYDSDPDYK